MSTPAILWFKQNGTVHGLYTEVISLAVIGALHVERATTIEFNPVLQEWEVRNRDGRRMYSSRSRHDCLGWEHDYFSHIEPDG